MYSFDPGALIFFPVSCTNLDGTRVELMATGAEASALLLFAHGARDASWAAPFLRMVARLRNKEPGVRVELAFLECMDPTLESAVRALAADGVEHITVVPLFLAQGGHLKNDLPKLLAQIRARHPSVEIKVSSSIGESEDLTNAIADWAFAQHVARSR